MPLGPYASLWDRFHPVAPASVPGQQDSPSFEARSSSHRPRISSTTCQLAMASRNGGSGVSRTSTRMLLRRKSNWSERSSSKERSAQAHPFCTSPCSHPEDEDCKGRSAERGSVGSRSQGLDKGVFVECDDTIRDGTAAVEGVHNESRMSRSGWFGGQDWVGPHRVVGRLVLGHTEPKAGGWVGVDRSL